MKILNLYCLLFFGFNFAQSESELQKLKTILLDDFPANIQFIHYENSNDELTDTLYFRFHRPEVKINQDSIHFSYIMEQKSWDEIQPRFEKLEWNLGFKNLEEFYGFEFTFGIWDRFKPKLFYWNFVDENAKVKSTKLTLEEFHNHLIPQNESSVIERSSWFPTTENSNQQLERLMRKIIRKQKQ